LITDDIPFYVRKIARDHGSAVGGAWRNKSPNTNGADQAPRLVIEWTADLRQPA
jgi:hypothetical protein